MAEILGISAGIVQLADVTIRTTVRLYAFFAALRTADDDFFGHLLVIRALHDALQAVQNVADGQILTPDEETALRIQLGRITDILSTMEMVTTGKDPNRLPTRIKWVLKRGHTDQALARLEGHKTSLVILLQGIHLRKSSQVLESQTDYTTTMSTLLSRAEVHDRQARAIQSNLQEEVTQLGIRLDNHVHLYQQFVQDGFASLVREIRVPEAAIGRTVHRELERHLRPVLEEVLRDSPTQDDRILQNLGPILNNTASQIQRCASQSQDRNIHKHPTQTHKLEIQNAEASSASARINSIFELSDTGIIDTKRNDGSGRPTKAWSYWGSITGVGTIRVEFNVYAEPKRRFYTIKFDFWPCLFLLRIGGFSLQYSSRPDMQGYIALCPSLAVRSVISERDPIWDMIQQSDITSIMSLFQQRKNTPSDQDTHGCSLLKCAVECGRYEVCQFLLTEGADPNHTTACGESPLQTLIENELYETMIGRYISCVCGHHLNESADGFSETIFRFIAAGGNLDDLDTSVYSIIDRPSFNNLHLSNVRFVSKKGNSADGSIAEGHLGPVFRDFRSSGRSGSNNFQLDEVEYLLGVESLAKFLSRQGLDVLQSESGTECCATLVNGASTMAFRTLKACGLKDVDPGQDGQMRSLLYTALYCFFNKPCGPGDLFYEVWMDNLTTVISDGADIYEIEWASEFWTDRVEDGLMTPTVYAEATDILPIWICALSKSGYNGNEVTLEDSRRRHKFLLTHGS